MTRWRHSLQEMHHLHKGPYGDTSAKQHSNMQLVHLKSTEHLVHWKRKISLSSKRTIANSSCGSTTGNLATPLSSPFLLNHDKVQRSTIENASIHSIEW